MITITRTGWSVSLLLLLAGTASCAADTPKPDLSRAAEGLSEGCCGNVICGPGESCASCPEDCGPCAVPECGVGACNGDETCDSCALDCGDCVTVTSGDTGG